MGLASAVIARAFHDDPLTVHLYPDEQQRMRLNPVMFEALVRYDCLFGQVDHLPGFTAVATWVRPAEMTETAERLAAAGFDVHPHLGLLPRRPSALGRPTRFCVDVWGSSCPKR